MASHFTVVYDACVLYPAPLRDLLMRLALTDMYRARWSNAIHDEWVRNVLANRADVRAEQLDRTRRLMDSHVRDALVENYDHLIPTVDLPDPNDRHVVAAAIHSGAELIVTYNLKDFPPHALDKFNLTAQHPDDFIVDLCDLNIAKVLEAAAAQRTSLKNPPVTVEEYLSVLIVQRLPQTVSILRPYPLAI